MCSEEEIQTSLQKKGRKLSITELRKYSGFENVGDHDAEKITESLYQLSVLCYSIYKSTIQKRKSNESGSI